MGGEGRGGVGDWQAAGEAWECASTAGVHACATGTRLPGFERGDLTVFLHPLRPPNQNTCKPSPRAPQQLQKRKRHALPVSPASGTPLLGLLQGAGMAKVEQVKDSCGAGREAARAQQWEGRSVPRRLPCCSRAFGIPGPGSIGRRVCPMDCHALHACNPRPMPTNHRHRRGRVCLWVGGWVVGRETVPGGLRLRERRAFPAPPQPRPWPRSCRPAPIPRRLWRARPAPPASDLVSWLSPSSQVPG